MYWRILQLLSRSRDPEDAHELAIRLMRRAQRHDWLLRLLRLLSAVPGRSLQQRLIYGTVFRSPVLLACGMDKDCTVFPILEALGFGSVEGGGVTPQAYPGNPRPRLFRDARWRMLINRMSFPSVGAEAVAANMSERFHQDGQPRGVNLVKAHASSLDQAPSDYIYLLETLRWRFDYFVINVSSPNMPGLRALTETIDQILAPVSKYAREHGIGPRRLLVKVSPDMSGAELQQVVAECVRFGIGGIIATNTTITRPAESPINGQAGGLSGAPLYELSLETVKYLAEILPDDMVLIACGGVTSAKRAYEMLRYADLVQCLSGFIFGGPFFAARLKWGIWWRLRRDGHRYLPEHNIRKGN